MDDHPDLFDSMPAPPMPAPPERKPVPEEDAPPVYHFAHPYPRFGLAYTLFHHNIAGDLEAVVADEERLASLAADVIDDSLNYVRLHTEDRLNDEGEGQLKYRRVAKADLKDETSNDQGAENRYYPWPHIATHDSKINDLIRKARDYRDKLREGKKFYSPDRELKRSFSPFTTKVNAGTKSLSNPKTTRLQAVFTLIATLARYKAGAYTPYRQPSGETAYCNQVIIPDLDVKNLLRFIALFARMHHSEKGDAYIAEVTSNSSWGRPSIHNGNYPGAPPTQAFGPVGLIGAMGRWIQRAGHISWAEDVLKTLTERPLYLVSYVQDLMRQAHTGHHVATLALTCDLPEALGGLYRAQHYNPDDNTPDSPNRQLFYAMTGRFLQFYTRAAFRDFLAFRVQYEASFSPILEDYFMNERKLSKALVQSARAYGKYLNRQALESGIKEEKTKNTNRTKWEAQTKVLNQMESVVMSSKKASEIFARLNREARQIDNYDAPAEAGPFMEAAIAGEIDLDAVKELTLAFMRLRTDEENGGDDVGDESPDPEDKMAGVD